MNAKELVASAGEAVAEMIDAGDGMHTPKVQFISAGYRPPVGTKLYTTPPSQSEASYPMLQRVVEVLEKLATHVRPTCSDLYDEAIAALAEARKVLAFVAAPAPAVVPDAKPEQGAGLAFDVRVTDGDWEGTYDEWRARNGHARQQRVVGWPSGVLNKTDTLSVIKQHNDWRRGAEGEQTDPRMLGLALDAVIAALEGERDGG